MLRIDRKSFSNVGNWGEQVEVVLELRASTHVSYSKPQGDVERRIDFQPGRISEYLSTQQLQARRLGVRCHPQNEAPNGQPLANTEIF